MKNEGFKTMLLYPPVADFTQPYPAIPYLAGFLKAKGENVVIKDINLEAHDYLLTDYFINTCYDSVNKRFKTLNNKPSLNPAEQREYIEYMNGIGVNPAVLSEINAVKEGFVKKDRFYDYDQYRRNVSLLKQALSLISAAYYPVKLEPGVYTTPLFLTKDDDITEQTRRDKNPFIEYYEECLLPFIRHEQPDLIGMSVVYPTQLLQMFAIAHIIRKAFPQIHICAGGAFVCRFALNLKQEKFNTVFEYLDSIVLYEGETALYNLISYLKTGADTPFTSPKNTIFHDRKNNATVFPPDEPYFEKPADFATPDYDGYPLDKYYSPALFLPYSPTRGCYWNKCAFCHYGSVKSGTSKYREKEVSKIIEDLDQLAEKYKTRQFSFCVDVISAHTLQAIAAEMIQKQRSYVWNTDVRFDDAYTIEACKKLKQAGCHAVAVGLESGNKRILKLMNKGVKPTLARQCIVNFSKAGIVTQVMSFLHFPTETKKEALETIKFISENQNRISLFTMGDFELLQGSEIFKNPAKFGLERIYPLAGDEYNIMYFYDEKNSKSEREQLLIEDEYAAIGSRYADNDSLFVGSVSTNHSLLYFSQFGTDILKKLARRELKAEEKKARQLPLNAVPVRRPAVKILVGNYNLDKLSNNVEQSAYMLSEKGPSSLPHGDVLNKFNGAGREFPEKSYSILIDDMKWMDMPEFVNKMLDVCDGKNKTKDIISFYPKDYEEAIYTILNKLFENGILILRDPA